MRFDINKVRKEVDQEMKFYENQSNQYSLLGIRLSDVRIHLRNDKIITGKIEKIGRYEIVVEREGKKIILLKHAIDIIEPL